MTKGLKLSTVPTERVRMSDWSAFTDFGGEAEIYAPENEAEICSVVKDCYNRGLKLRVVALRTSWNCFWHSEDVMMTTGRLKAIVKVDPEKHTVTCQPGVGLAVLHKALYEKGLTLETAPAPDWVTVAGCICTGSHGSGPASMSSSVIGCRLVTANGEVLELREGDERLNAASLSLGLLGVFSEITLRVVDAFHVRLSFSRIPLADWRRYLTEGEMSYLLWFAHTEECVFGKVDRLPAGVEDDLRGASRPSEPAFDMSVVAKYMYPLNELANIAPHTFPARNRYFKDVFFPSIQVSGPAYKVLMSFQASGPIAGAEWCVPASRFGDALADLQTEITSKGLYLPAPVWLKKVKGEKAWLSAADEECVQCGIYHNLTPGAPSHVKEMVTRVERLMLRHGGRPHLGKLIYLSSSDLTSAYPNWSKFNNLRKDMDPSGVFWTEALRERFGD